MPSLPHSPPPTTPPRNSFTRLVRAEELPTSLHWHGRDTIAVLAVPAILLGGWLASLLHASPSVGALTDTGIRLIAFLALVIANAALLRHHWQAFRRATWRSIGLVILGMVVIQVVITLLGSVLRPLSPGAGTGQETDLAADLPFAVMLIASFGPTLTALIEDFTFRHTLLLKLPVWRSRALATALVIINALVFGAIHLNNFGGRWLLTLSYAGAGLVMNLVYLWTRNIWHVLLMHALNNFLLGGPIALLLVQLLGAQAG